MSLLPTIGAVDQDTGFYNGVATQSVRFNQPSSSYLYKSVSDGTRTTSTFAWWMKRGQSTIGSYNIGEIFCFGGSGGGGSQSSGRITLEDNKINISQEDSNSVTWQVITTQLLRDHSSWYHCVVVIDTTQGTAANRVKVYINGNKVTSFSTATYPSQNLSTRFGLNGVNKVGVSEASGNPWSATYFDGYFADMYYLDGVAVAPEAFGEDKNGVWIPKEYETKPSLIAQNTGSAIGDMTDGGGLAGAFNGTRFQNYASSAQQTSSQATSYIGKNWSGSSKTVTGFILYSNTQFGFVGGGASTFTVKLYGKDGSPSNSTDGTLLFTSSAVTDANSRGAIRYFADTNIQSEETISNFTTTTAFTYHWVVITPNASEGAFVSEIEFYEDGSTNYGTNGFRLEFNQTGTGTGASDTIGADSGNTNHYTSSGIDADGCNMPDSPENNFCTMNPSGRRYGQSYVSTFSEGALKVINADVSSNSNGNSTHNWGTMAINQIASQGGVYFEVRMDSLDTARTYFGVIGDNGANNKSADANGAGYSFPIKGVIADDPRGYFTTDTDSSGSLDLTANTAFSNGDVAGIAILSDGKFFCHRNGTYLNNADGNTGNPSTGANPIATIDLTLGDWLPYVGYNSNFTLNFGQDGTFSDNETPADTYTDSNSIGKFNYAVPTNCFALCTSNMAEPTIGPNSTTKSSEHFAPLIYSASSGSAGAGSSTPQDIDGLDFKPDLVWIKGRSYTDHHALFDSSRGVGKYLLSSATNAEGSVADTLDEFRSDGFGLGADSTALVNYQNNTYVSWNWKANGGTTTTNDASSTGVGSIDSVIQANTDAGFSIVTHTGTDSVGTIAHGLGKKPALIITKGLSAGYNWFVYNHISGATKALLFDAVTEDSYATTYNNTEPTSSVFTVGTASATNGGSINYINYIFAEIEGYSKIGTYIANENADGPFIYTGFRPALVVVKKLASAQGWEVTDAARNPFNEMNKHLLWDTTAGDTTADPYDFCANGFKLRTSGYTRNRVAGKVLLYMAFAEAPFKYANAR